MGLSFRLEWKETERPDGEKVQTLQTLHSKKFAYHIHLLHPLSLLTFCSLWVF